MNAEEVSQILLKLHAVSLQTAPPYTWVSGIKSPIYCDNRIILSHSSEREKIIDSFINLIRSKELRFDIVGGVATSGIPWASIIAHKLSKPLIYVRASAKDHGKGNQIEGRLDKGQTVIIIEDLISTGGSSFSAIEAVRSAGGIVNDCVAVFSYNFDEAKKKFSEGNCNLYPLSDIDSLINSAVKSGYIKESEQLLIKDFFLDTKNWGAKHGF